MKCIVVAPYLLVHEPSCSNASTIFSLLHAKVNQTIDDPQHPFCSGSPFTRLWVREGIVLSHRQLDADVLPKVREPFIAWGLEGQFRLLQLGTWKACEPWAWCGLGKGRAGVCEVAASGFGLVPFTLVAELPQFCFAFCLRISGEWGFGAEVILWYVRTIWWFRRNSQQSDDFEPSWPT